MQVIINDGVLMPFENALNYSRFAVRVAEADIPRLPEILQAISLDQVQSMQVSILQTGYALCRRANRLDNYK